MTVSDFPVPPPDPREQVMRRICATLLHRVSVMGQVKMHPARDVKMEAVIDNQVVIMQALAFVLDDMVQAGGGSAEIRFQEAAPENGAGLVVT